MTELTCDECGDEAFGCCPYDDDCQNTEALCAECLAKHVNTTHDHGEQP